MREGLVAAAARGTAAGAAGCLRRGLRRASGARAAAARSGVGAAGLAPLLPHAGSGETARGGGAPPGLGRRRRDLRALSFSTTASNRGSCRSPGSSPGSSDPDTLGTMGPASWPSWWVARRRRARDLCGRAERRARQTVSERLTLGRGSPVPNDTIGQVPERSTSQIRLPSRKWLRPSESANKCFP